MNLIKLDPRTGLEKQLLFWLAVLLPVFLALGLAIPVWLEYSLSFSAKSYSTFLKISALPIGISSLSIPLGVLIGRLHGTKQTALQINEAQATNRTNLYLSHYSHFKDHFGKNSDYHIDLFNELSMSFHAKTLYQNIYPDNGLIYGVKPPTPEPILDVWNSVLSIINYVDNLTTKINESSLSEDELIKSSKHIDAEMKFTFPRAGFKISHNFSMSNFRFKDIKSIVSHVISETMKAKEFEPAFKETLENELLYKTVTSLEKLKSNMKDKRVEIENVETTLRSYNNIFSACEKT
ncbi:hypothetical protein [Salinivibrio sp. IB643]|uniref:hypothetical protein n=1 Tax=Salinivibrio sp. IB643 TaxID=1909445 RepID=UPI00098905DD|nr:hypothetical protein [Salinivibrio sp. IB643]OOE94089.1 hypothetical protein BZG77_14185 [Salinivibrio sp. IB643]